MTSDSTKRSISDKWKSGKPWEDPFFLNYVFFSEETDESWMCMLYKETSIKQTLHLWTFDPDAWNLHNVNSSSTFDSIFPTASLANVPHLPSLNHAKTFSVCLVICNTYREAQTSYAAHQKTRVLWCFLSHRSFMLHSQEKSHWGLTSANEPISACGTPPPS